MNQPCCSEVWAEMAADFSGWIWYLDECKCPKKLNTLFDFI